MGADGNAGTLAAPFATIQHAADVAQAGDTVFVRGGTYRETITPAHSGSANAPIIFEPYNGETVTISGADPVTNWSAYQNSIYSTNPGWNLGAGFNQAFLDGNMLTEARFPNNTASDLFHATTAKASNITSSANPNGPFGNTETATIQSSDLTAPAGTWDGATIHIAPGQGWVWQTGTVTDSQPGSLTYTYTQLNTSWQIPDAGNHFYLTGKFQALDSPGEWFLDSTTGTLYVWTPQSDSPASHDLELKHRQFAFDLSGLSFVDVRGFNLFADSIDTSASSHDLVLSNLNAKYISQQTNDPNPFLAKSTAPTTGFLINGNNITLSDSTINFSSGNGVAITGSNDTVQNCFITNIDYSGQDGAAIVIQGTSAQSNQITRNTIYNTGRNGILDYFGPAEHISNNLIHDIGLMTSDGGGIYTYKTNGGGTEISFNISYNARAGGFGNDGLFLDTTSSKFVLDHNLVWNVDTGLKMNGPLADNNDIFNNTLIGVAAAFTGYPTDEAGSIFENNIFVGAAQFGTGIVQQHNLTSGSPGFINAGQNNYQLATGSPAIDAGMVISPYTDGFVGAAPDQGAYEFGATPWTAGATVVPPPVYTPPSDGGTGGNGGGDGGTTTPPANPSPVSAMTQIAASSYAANSGAQNNTNGTILLAPPDWLRFASIDFGTTGVKTLKVELANAATKMGLKIQFRADSLTGPLIATLTPSKGKRGATLHMQSAHAKKITGVHDLFISIVGKTGQVDLDWFSFIPLPPKHHK